jgi:hypothetical protein
MYLPDSLDHPPLNVRRRTSFREFGNSAGAVKSFPRGKSFRPCRERVTAKEKANGYQNHVGSRYHTCSRNFDDLTTKRSLAAADLEDTMGSAAFMVAEVSMEVLEGSAVDVLGAASAFMVAGILTFGYGCDPYYYGYGCY